jgi:spore coat protein U-like protein
MKLRAAALTLVALASTGSALAATSNSTLGVRVVVLPNCTVSSATLDFGTYVSGQAAALNGSTSIAYTNCPAGTLKFELDNGLNGTTATRRMTNGSGGLLAYGLYKDSARTLNFAEGGSAKNITLTATGAGNVPVYGVVPAAQAVAEGTYTDTVQITLTF